MKTDQQRLVEAYEQVEEDIRGTLSRMAGKASEIGIKLGRRGIEAAKGKLNKLASEHRARKAVRNMGKREYRKVNPDGTTTKTTVQREWDLKHAAKVNQQAAENKALRDAWKEEHKGLVNTGKAVVKAAPYAAAVGGGAYGYDKFADMRDAAAEKVGAAVGNGVETVRSAAAHLGDNIRNLKNDVVKAAKDAKEGMEGFGSKTLNSVAGFVKDHPIATAATIAAVPVAISGVRALADKFGGDDDDEEADESVGSRCDESSPEDDLVAGMDSRGCRFLGVDDGLICFEHDGELVAFTSWDEVADAVGAQ